MGSKKTNTKGDKKMIETLAYLGTMLYLGIASVLVHILLKLRDTVNTLTEVKGLEEKLTASKKE